MASTPNLEILTSRPQGAPVVRDYLEGEASALGFFRRHFASEEDYRAKAREVDSRFDADGRRRAAEALRVPPGADPDRLERFVSQGGYMVTTGQQPALLGGPLYNLYKGLTAVRLAQALEGALDVPVLPVFWVGSEDHDWDEANHTALVGMDNELHTWAVASPHPDRTPALHRVALGAELEEVAAEMLSHLPETDFSDPFAELLLRAARSGETLASGFHTLLQPLLGRLGVYFTDAADPGVKEASRPVLLQELHEAEGLESRLTHTVRELEKAGYGVQATVMEKGVNLFLDGPRGRERLYRDEGGFRLRTSGRTLSASEVEALVDSDPGALSPNVFLRPVVESAVFPTLAYVGGPGEMAYFAQLGSYFEAFGIEMPIVHPRCSATVVETKIRKVLEKFGLQPNALDRPFHEIASEITRDEVPDNVKRALGGLKGAVAKGVADLEKEVRAIDPTLKGPVQHIRSQAFQALDEAEKKVVHALKRENEIALSQLEKAQLHLFPLGKPQERVINPFYYLTRYGDGFIDALLARFESGLG